MRENLLQANEIKRRSYGLFVRLIPGTRIALVIPSPEAELRLSIQLGIPGPF